MLIMCQNLILYFELIVISIEYFKDSMLVINRWIGKLFLQEVRLLQIKSCTSLS